MSEEQITHARLGFALGTAEAVAIMLKSALRLEDVAPGAGRTAILDALAAAERALTYNPDRRNAP